MAPTIDQTMERVTRIELASSDWKSEALPLSYTRERARPYAVGEGGFEPPTACPQSRCATTAPLPGQVPMVRQAVMPAPPNARCALPLRHSPVRFRWYGRR